MKKVKIVGNVGNLVANVVGRTATGDLIIDFSIAQRLVVEGVEDTDKLLFMVNSLINLFVNGEKAEDSKQFGIDWKKDMIIDKKGNILYKDTRKPVIGSEKNK